ncbi:hypothetical protein IAR55_002628 [Kwoniella newhampshirensis]|uniref:Major facilitator superfamily (MFS) profile domain-containing protein n=1 Tax=Kwoniella newhampshirensis TaxID=1651941 RepID=A0AAW0YNI7_9TREE
MTTNSEKNQYSGDEKGSYPHDPVISLVEADYDPKEVALAEDTILAESQYTEEDYNKLKWKFDLILLPCMMLTYGLQYSDKVSLSSGVVFGLRKDTHLTSEQYPNLTVYFYVAYLAGQIPMGYAMQRLPLGKTLGAIIILWGIVVIGLGLCNNYLQLSMCRVLLGWFECAVTPGFLLIVASWYKRSEATLRSCFFFAMNTFLGGVFGIIIYAIAKKSQTGGTVAGWRAINYFLGSLTVLAGVLVFIFVGVPSEVWWLNKEQKKMAHARIVSNATGDGGRKAWNWAQVKECFRDPQWYFTILFNLTATIPNGMLGAFSNLVYVGFGFTPLQSVLYGLPSNAVGFTVVICSAVFTNYYPRARFPLAILWILVQMIVFLYVGLATSAGKWQLWACFCFSGVFACSTFLLWPIMSINAAGRTKKTFIGATGLIAYCVGNMVGSQTMRPSDAPRYLKGLTANAIVLGMEVIVLACWYAYYMWENKRRDAAFIASGVSMEEREFQNKLAGETDVTDRQNPHFRYAC